MCLPGGGGIDANLKRQLAVFQPPAGKEKVEVDPESFVVREGKLYLFYKGFFNDTRSKWQKDPADFVKRGDTAWKEITAKPLPEKKK